MRALFSYLNSTAGSKSTIARVYIDRRFNFAVNSTYLFNTKQLPLIPSLDPPLLPIIDMQFFTYDKSNIGLLSSVTIGKWLWNKRVALKQLIARYTEHEKGGGLQKWGFVPCQANWYARCIFSGDAHGKIAFCAEKWWKTHFQNVATDSIQMTYVDLPFWLRNKNMKGVRTFNESIGSGQS